MEKVKASERRCLRWRYSGSLAIRLRVDAEWDHNGVHQQSSGHKSGWLGESPSVAGT